MMPTSIFVDAVGDNLYPAFELLARRADGDYRLIPRQKAFLHSSTGLQGSRKGLAAGTCSRRSSKQRNRSENDLLSKLSC